MRHRKVALFLVLSSPAAATPALSAQSSVGVGADFVSRYVWRGADFGESFSVQPGISIVNGGFEIGAWGSYSLSADGAGANENDLYVSYTVESGSGASFTFGLTDYYFPAPDAEHGFLHRESHFFEPFVSFSTAGDTQASLFLGMMSYLAGHHHHEHDHEEGEIERQYDLYVEGSLSWTVSDTEIGLALGIVGGESGFYGTEGAAATNLGVTFGRELAITDDFALPLSASYIFNPDADRSYLVFGFSLSN